MFARESGQRVNFDGGVNASDLCLCGESGAAVEMEHIQPEGGGNMCMLICYNAAELS